jgi:2-iminoacetate synthase ThiH
MDAGLKRELEAKITAGQRLGREDGLALFESDDLAWLGRLAHAKRTELNGDRVLFSVDPQLNLGSESFESSTLATMLYGQGEEPSHRVDQIMGLRDLQDEKGDFKAFILLCPTATVAPVESLKTFAVSRLLFDNVPHVTCSLATHGQPIAALVLNFGADDLDGAPIGDTQRDDLLNLIWDAGFRPVERDRQYAVEREYDAAPRLADRRSEPQQVWA